MITLYDLASTLETKIPLEPSSWTVRLMLDDHDIPYKTEWIDFIDIPHTYHRFGLAPDPKDVEGNDQYTLPIIYDDRTGIAVADQFDVARYLDEEYRNGRAMQNEDPTATPLIPDKTDALQAAFADAVDEALFPGVSNMVPLVVSILPQASKEGYWKERRAAFDALSMDSAPVEVKPDVSRTGSDTVHEVNLGMEEGTRHLVSSHQLQDNWSKLQSGLDRIDGWFKREGRDWPAGFVMSRFPTYADYHLAGYLVWFKTLLGQYSEGWKDICSLNEGRWETYVDLFGHGKV